MINSVRVHGGTRKCGDRPGQGPAVRGDDAMTLNDFYDTVARRADTAKTKINAVDTRRVLAEAFKVLAKLDAAGFTEVVATGVATAKKKS
jgi:hypothetical protein